jgi:hypothetical protein
MRNFLGRHNSPPPPSPYRPKVYYFSTALYCAQCSFEHTITTGKKGVSCIAHSSYIPSQFSVLEVRSSVSICTSCMMT